MCQDCWGWREGDKGRSCLPGAWGLWGGTAWSQHHQNNTCCMSPLTSPHPWSAQLAGLGSCGCSAAGVGRAGGAGRVSGRSPATSSLSQPIKQQSSPRRVSV